MTHRYTITGIPRSGKNSQRQFKNKRTGARFTVKSKAAASWLANAITQLVMQKGRKRTIAAACRVDIVIYHALPLTSWDADNVQNLVFDALKHALVIVDDKAAIVRQGSFDTWQDKANPRVEVTIAPMVVVQDVAA